MAAVGLTRSYIVIWIPGKERCRVITTLLVRQASHEYLALLLKMEFRQPSTLLPLSNLAHTIFEQFDHIFQTWFKSVY